MEIPVLTYHSTNISGNDYHNNDLVAFQVDLQLIKELGIEIISANQLVDWLVGKQDLDTSKNVVLITCYDGC